MAPGSIPPTLPPSVEAAYKLKCIALKKRSAEIDEYNDATRQRIIRQNRAIRKMRLQRALLVKHVGDINDGKGLKGFAYPDDPDTEGSSEGPPTVNLSLPISVISNNQTHHLSSPTKNHSVPNEVIAVPSVPLPPS